MTAVRVALLGCGVVGTEVARALAVGSDSLAQLSARVGAPLELVGIAVRDLDAPRDPVVDRSLLTTDASALVRSADVVVELVGGIEPTRTLLLEAFAAGASVVSANKALLAQEGPALHDAAAAGNADLYFEAAVAGAIPIIRPLRDSLAGDRVERVLGIVNGTTNYVLDQMDTSGAEFDDAVAQAQQLGYAEADPTADVEGFDAASKAALIATLAFHTPVSVEDVHREGITRVTAADVAAARDAGMVVKLLAICERTAGEDGEGLQVRVHPALVPRSHPLAGVRGAFNAVFVEAASAGELMFYGRGAGGEPTSSAVLGDLVTVARHRADGVRSRSPQGDAGIPVRPIGEARTRYQVRLDVADRPGVLAAVAGVFAEHGVSIETVRQRVVGPAVPDAAPGSGPGAGTGAGPGTGTATSPDGGLAERAAELVVTTHESSDGALSATVAQLQHLESVAAVASVLRVEGI